MSGSHSEQSRPDGRCAVVTGGSKAIGLGRAWELPGRYSCTEAGLNHSPFSWHRTGFESTRCRRARPSPLMLERTPDVEQVPVARIPSGRAGRPVDVAQQAGFRCSLTAGFVTGTNLGLDRGEGLC